MHQSLTFIGLGNMGTPMAANLIRGGLPVYVYNRTPEKAASLVESGAKLLNTPAEAFQKTKIVLSMLANDEALEQVTLGPNGLYESIKPDCIHISMSTVSPKTSRKLAILHQEKGAHFIAAPVFGRPQAAANRKLWICIAGESSVKKQIEPILKLLGQKIEDFGEDPGNANIVKLAGNFLILTAIEALGEALAIGERNGIDSERLASFFADTLFASPVYQTYANLIASSAFDPAGFKLHLGLKDINLLQDVAQESRVPIPIASLLHDLLLEGLVYNRGDLDWSAITMTIRHRRYL